MKALQGDCTTVSLARQSISGQKKSGVLARDQDRASFQDSQNNTQPIG